MYLNTRSKLKTKNQFGKIEKLLGMKIKPKNKVMKKLEDIKDNLSSNSNLQKISDSQNYETKITKNLRNNKKLKMSFLRRIKYDEKIYFDFIDLLKFLKIFTSLDYENILLKDEEKQEFQAKANYFLTNNCRIVNYKKILILEDEIDNFFLIFENILLHNNSKFTIKMISHSFFKYSKEFKLEGIDEENKEYIPAKAFISDSLIKVEENNKKKTWQYMKYKTIPKWHHYALDIINQIANSRKSFIFSKQVKDDDNSIDFHKKGIDIDSIMTKLKYKIYNNIYEFFDDVHKMIKYFKELMQKNNSILSLNLDIKNVKFCKTMESRIDKYFCQLKEENKI